MARQFSKLVEASVAVVRNQASGVQGIEANLQNGTVVFGSERVASLGVIAREAGIRPADDIRTVVKISVAGPKELRIRARRGALH